MARTGGWERLAAHVGRWWDDDRVRAFANAPPGPAIAPDALEALQEAGRRRLLDLPRLWNLGRGLRERQFEVLGAAVPPAGGWPWHTDWRWNHTWPAGYFRSYDYFAPRDVPYDVKVPWELSRLWFIPPMLQAAAIGPDEGLVESLDEIVLDWERRNPLGYTINWYPMEASMRAISLVLALDMLRGMGRQDAGRFAPLLRLASQHGEFIWRTIEYSDVRGNHYAANIVALLLLGLLLGDLYPPARRWAEEAERRVPPEIERQLLPDGVDFEKSVGYHRLVTELFLLAVIALERSGRPGLSAARDRLREAARYAAACRRPDGRAVNAGDNDSAQVFTWDHRDSADHAALIGLAAAYWREPQLRGAVPTMPASLVWLLGMDGLAAWEQTPAKQPGGVRHFIDGGVATARHGGSYLWVDVGEVGVGHGHNDLLSFELVLRNRPLVVDPGCFCYSADLELRDLFRATAYHNGLQVDDAEIAPMSGLWEIGRQAAPVCVEVVTDGPKTVVRAGHKGYLRLSDPVLHLRELAFDPSAESLVCTDRLACQGRHTITRRLHLHPSVSVALEDGAARLSAAEGSWTLHWREPAEASVEPGWVSPGYGVRQDAEVVVLTNAIDGTTQLQFVVEREEVSVRWSRC